MNTSEKLQSIANEISTAPEADSAAAKLQRLRGENRRQLALQNRNSLYSVLGVPADASDAEVAQAIAIRLEPGAALDAETRYAVDILGNVEAREQFDRKLLGQLSTRFVAAARVTEATDLPPVAARSASWQSWVAGGLLLLGAGYLWLGHSRDQAERELRLKEVEARQEEVRLKAIATEKLLETRAIAVDASNSRQQQAIEYRERMAAEAIQRQDRQNFESALRQEQHTEQAEQRRVQIEQARTQAEIRRRDMEAQAATRVIRQQAIQDAMARGNINEAQRLRSQQY